MIHIESLEDTGINELLLSRMTTPKEAYEAGESMGTDANFCNLLEWQLIADDVEKLVAQDPMYCRRAIEGWPIRITTDKNLQTFISGMAQSLEDCFAAGYMEEEKYNLVGDTVQETVAQSPLRSAWALCRWPIRRRTSKLEKAVLSDPEASLYLLENHNTQGNPHYLNKRALVDRISKHSGYIFIMNKLNLNPHYAVDSVPPDSEVEEVSNISRREFELASKAYNMISEDHRSQFAEGFRGALKENQLQQWCQHVIDNYHKDAIGGDTYRGVSA